MIFLALASIRTSSSDGNLSTRYMIARQKFCRDSFLAVARISENILLFHSNDCGNGNSITPYSMQRPKSRRSKLVVNFIAAIAFIKSYADINGAVDPRGRNIENN